MIRQPPTDLSPEETLDVTLDAVLQRWGRYSWANWDVFAPIVELRLKSVEAQAREWHEADDRGWAVTYYDLCRASWTVIKRAIGALRPADGIVDVFAGQALDRLPQERWPSSMPVPIEAQDYLVLAGQYVWRWTVTQVAELLKVDERTVNTARRRAVKVLARQILAWEATPTSAA